MTPTPKLKFSPSRAHRWMLCPGSVSLTATIPEPPFGPAAKLGIDVHRAAALLLEGGDIPEDLSSLVEKSGKWGDMISYVEFVRGMWKDLGGDLLIEYSFDLPFSGRKGIVDAAIVLSDSLYVIDLKTGKYPVNAYKSEQLRLYASEFMVAHEEKWPGLKDFYLTIFQPTLPDMVSTGYFTKKEILDFREQVLKTHALAVGENPPFVPGKAQCKWCPAIDRCEAYLDWVVPRSVVL